MALDETITVWLLPEPSYPALIPPARASIVDAGSLGPWDAQVLRKEVFVKVTSVTSLAEILEAAKTASRDGAGTFYPPSSSLVAFGRSTLPGNLRPEVTLADGSGLATWGNRDFSRIRWSDIKAAAEAGAIRGDPAYVIWRSYFPAAERSYGSGWSERIKFAQAPSQSSTPGSKHFTRAVGRRARSSLTMRMKVAIDTLAARGASHPDLFDDWISAAPAWDSECLRRLLGLSDQLTLELMAIFGFRLVNSEYALRETPQHGNLAGMDPGPR